MKHNTNTNTQQSKTANTQPRVYESVTREEMNQLAIEVSSQVHTCKQASARYAEFADRFGKDVAKEILAMAKAHVKARVQAVTDDAKSVREWLSSGKNVAKSAWEALLRDEDVQGRKWARFVYESAGCDLAKMALKYADYVAPVMHKGLPVCYPDGEPMLAVAKRSTRKDANGERVSGFAPMGASVGAWLSALKTAVKNAKKSALGASRSEYQRTVTLTWDE